MSFNLKGRSYLKLLDFTQRELLYLLDLSRDLKRAKYAGSEQQRLKGKNICLIFEKTSTRTRCAFEVAAYDQGANVTYLDPIGSARSATRSRWRTPPRVLGRMYDAIEFRGNRPGARRGAGREHSGVPVYNGLTDEWHPTQMLADFLTMREHATSPRPIAVCLPAATRDQHGALTADRRRMMGATCASPARGHCSPAEIVTKAKRSRELYGGTDDHHRGPDEAVAASTSSTPTSGSRWASRPTSGDPD